TNRFGGDIFEYMRNSSLDARNFFDYGYQTTGRRLPEFQRNNFGGAFGGPIKKNKTFFFGVYEGLRQNLGITIIDTVMPGNCHVPTGNPCAVTATNPAGNVAPVVLPLLALYPSPNLGLTQVTFPSAAPTEVNYGQMRVDQNFSASDMFFTRYTIDESFQDYPGSGVTQFASTTSGYAPFRYVSTGGNQFLTLSENHIFSPTTLNTARFSFSRTNIQTNNSFAGGPSAFTTSAL